jgi:hypothetical protein
MGRTPTVAHFEKVEETHGGAADDNGFFSPMMNETIGIGPSSSSGHSTPGSAAPSSTRQGEASSYEEDEEDDLGLGNSSSRKVVGDGKEDVKPAAAAAAGPVKEAEKKAGMFIVMFVIGLKLIWYRCSCTEFGMAFSFVGSQREYVRWTCQGQPWRGEFILLRQGTEALG